jgi:hypothetical protein
MVPSMRGRTIRIAVALCGLAGGVYAAEEATTPAGPTLEQTIAQQLVQEGQVAQQKGATAEIEHYTPDQMMALASSYDQEMRRSVDHAQDVKILAYRSHDIIRMTCIDDKVDQIKQVITLTESRYLMLRSFKSQVIIMQSQFAIISAAHARVRELTSEIDACMGDSLDAVSIGRIEEETTAPTNAINDPTRPQSSITSIERPPEASPYR